MAFSATGGGKASSSRNLELPYAKRAGELRHSQAGDLLKSLAGVLRGEVAVLFDQTPSEPNLPNRQAG
ncbi:MAG: hypothetical protein ABSF22_25555 [Bryobacteraceae bacterium]